MATEKRAMARVLVYMNVSPAEVYGLLEESDLYNSYRDAAHQLEKDYGPASIRAAGISEGGNEVLARTVVYIQHCDEIKEPKSFIKATNFMLTMREHLRLVPTMNNSLKLFLQQTSIKGSDAHSLNVWHGVHDYKTLKEKENELMVGDLKGVSHNACVLLGMILASFPLTKNLNYLQDPLCNFSYRLFLQQELSSFCQKLGTPSYDTQIVITNIPDCTYKRMVKEIHNLDEGLNGFHGMDRLARNTLARAFFDMKYKMQDTHPFLRMRLYFTERLRPGFFTVPVTTRFLTCIARYGVTYEC